MHKRLSTILGIGVLLLAPAAFADLTLPPLVTSMGHSGDPIVHAGFLDVTLYGADPTGTTDSTKAIQAAINDARDYMMTTYLPAGTYLVSDTLVGSEDGNGGGATFCYQVAGNLGTAMGGEFVGAQAPTLIGPPSGPRAILKLKDASAGFGSTSSPKPVVHFVDLGPPSQYVNAVVGAFDCLMYSVIRDVDVELGTGNAGAVGIQYYSAQFSYMANVSVDATGGYAGIQGAPATSDWSNLAVTGGQYGILLDNAGTSSLAGVTVSGQTTAGLALSASGAIAVTGFQITETTATPIVVNAFNGVPQIGGVSLFDGTIEALSATTTAITNGHGVNLVVQNVYVDAKAGLVASASQTPIAGSGSTDRIDEYAYTDLAVTGAPYAPNTSYDLIDGVVGQNGMARTTQRAGAAPTDFVIRHLPGALPWFTDKGVVDATAMGADPTGFKDSTSAIQAAIDASEGKGDEVFLPRGTYLVSGTLKLHPDTKLFGIPGLKATLWASTWSPMGVFTPFIQTADTATGKTFVGDIQLMLPDDNKDGLGYDQSYLYALEWQAGRSSVLYHFVAQLTPDWSTTTAADSAARKTIHVAKNGGGRWYGLQEGGDPTYCRDRNADFRFLFVDGTTAPLTIYGPNLEHAPGDDFIEVSNASNVRIFESKTECDTTWLAVEGSKNVLLAGLSGDWQPNKVGVLFSDSTNVQASILGWYADESNTTSMYVSSTGGGYPNASIAWANAVSLFQNGTFDESAFPHCGDGFCDGAETEANCAADCRPAGGGGDGGTKPDAGGGRGAGHGGSDAGVGSAEGGSGSGEAPGRSSAAGGCACNAGRTGAAPGVGLALVLVIGGASRRRRRG
jgi:MYXO-CTERM domain-containing protein